MIQVSQVQYRTYGTVTTVFDGKVETQKSSLLKGVK